MAKKKKIENSIEKLSFRIFLLSFTVTRIKELINFYNENYSSDNGKLKGYSKLRKIELANFLDDTIPAEKKSELIKEFEKDFVEKIILDGLSLITGENKVEKIKNAAIIGEGKGYNVWFFGKYGSTKASLQINKDSVKRDCNCKIGKLGGLCHHQMAISLMLINKNIIEVDQLPFKVEKEFFKSIEKRLDLLATAKLFRIEPTIMFEDEYKIFINEDLVTLEWGGHFPGKKTMDFSQEEDDKDTWVAQKVTDLIVRYIKVKQKTGYPTKIIIDSYDIISKIINNPKMVSKILRKFTALEDTALPNNEKELETYLKNNLKESSVEAKIEPPFNAYMGEGPYLFVSYTHKDKADVYPIINKLNSSGIKIWYDEGIPLSTDWCNTIAEKLIGCNTFLSFISPNVNNSDNTQDEIFLAMEEKKPFLAVYLEDTDLNPGIKMRIRRIQGILKYEMNEKEFYTKLIEHIGNVPNSK